MSNVDFIIGEVKVIVVEDLLLEEVGAEEVEKVVVVVVKMVMREVDK